MPEPTPDLDESYVAPVKSGIGAIELYLADHNGTADGMSATGTLRILDAAGNVIALRHGDPKKFMPLAWQAKVKAILDELRDNVTARLMG